jgi:hypothetical protein
MADNDNLVSKAEPPARRRMFVARGAQPPEPSIAPSPPPPPPPVPAPEPEFEDIPLLTEVFVTSVDTPMAVAESPAPPEPPEPEVPPAPPEPPPPPPPPEPPEIPQEMIDARALELLQAQLPFQRQAVADELAGWLDTELPQVVMHVIDGVTDQLIAKITEEARAALLPRLQEALEADNISLDDES